MLLSCRTHDGMTNKRLNCLSLPRVAELCVCSIIIISLLSTPIMMQTVAVTRIHATHNHFEFQVVSCCSFITARRAFCAQCQCPSTARRSLSNASKCVITFSFFFFPPLAQAFYVVLFSLCCASLRKAAGRGKNSANNKEKCQEEFFCVSCCFHNLRFFYVLLCTEAYGVRKYFMCRKLRLLSFINFFLTHQMKNSNMQRLFYF